MTRVKMYMPSLTQMSSIDLLRTPNGLFSQSWAQQGKLQVLVIKRAKQEGNRWSARVALLDMSSNSSLTIHASNKEAGRRV
jgi:hypothetical protein